MKAPLISKLLIWSVFSCLTTGLTSCVNDEKTVKEVMDNVIDGLYKTKDAKALSALDNDKVMALFSDPELQVLSSRYWMFDVNVPAVVSVMRSTKQEVVPFWLSKSGFVKTDMTLKNEQIIYEVWQKSFDTGTVGLGINGFENYPLHYFVSVAPQNLNDNLELSNFFPENQFVGILRDSAFTYHDWDELVLSDVPESMKGQKLLTTIRGRGRETHLIGAFRTTPFPSSEKPDQVILTWSEDPSTTQTIQWRTNPRTKGVARFWEDGAGSKDKFTEISAEHMIIEDRLLQNDRLINHYTSTLRELKSASNYRYIVGDPALNSWSEEAVFTTGPNGAAPFSFVYFGDTHRSPEWGRMINKAFERHPNTAFYIIGGDLVSTGLYRDEWDKLFGYSANVLNKRSLMPVPGNHDNQAGLGAKLYTDLFSLPMNGPAKVKPEQSYSFEFSNALYLMLDATSSYSDQVEWIENQLKQTKAKWKFAVLHFPPYCYEEDYKEIRDKWGTIFDKYHVDMVMSGHVHYYMRSKPMRHEKPVASPADGTIYVISIAIPDNDGPIPEQYYAEVQLNGEMLYQTLDIKGDSLVYKAINIDGVVRDQMVIAK